jgi:hypothetical protein
MFLFCRRCVSAVLHSSCCPVDAERSLIEFSESQIDLNIACGSNSRHFGDAEVNLGASSNRF